MDYVMCMLPIRLSDYSLLLLCRVFKPVIGYMHIVDRKDASTKYVYYPYHTYYVCS